MRTIDPSRSSPRSVDQCGIDIAGRVITEEPLLEDIGIYAELL